MALEQAHHKGLRHCLSTTTCTHIMMERINGVEHVGEISS
jgi:hypothetical protein